MGEGYWVIRTYESGAVGEKTKFWVSGDRNRRNRKREKGEIRKQEQNEYAAVKRLARLINTNFRAGDLLVGLDYDADGYEWLGKEPEEIRASAERELRLLLRRMKRALEKQGQELRYVAITSDMDGDTGEAVRVHHHMILPREALKILREKWKRGGVHWEKLRRQADYLPMAEYLLRQVRRIPDAKKYMRSRNLREPKAKDRVAVTEAEVRMPKGGRLLLRNTYRPGSPQYIRYILPQYAGIFGKF